MDHQASKKRKLSNASLILGIVSILVPVLYSFGTSFFFIGLEKPIVPIPGGLYIFKIVYLGLITSGFFLGVVALTLKPRAWNKDAAKIAIGLIFSSFSLFYFGRIIFFS